MKKLINLLLFLMIFSFNINVFADEENSNETDKSNNQIEDKEETNNDYEGPVTNKSSDATLKEVYINEEKVICTDYVCEKVIKDNSIEKVKITYKTTHSKAVVSKNKIEEKLEEGENEFSVIVTAEDGESKETYTFKITKELLSTDSSLNKLVINGEEITLKKDTLKYEASVSYGTKKLEIEAIPTDSEASIEGFKNDKASFDFYEDKKEIKLKVKAEDESISTYTITVNKRDKKDASLKTLTITGATLNFKSDVYDYETNVLKSVEQLEITATPTDLDANVTITKPDNLEIGENVVTIKVENDGNINTYTVKVVRLNQDDRSLANLESLKIKGYELDFKEDQYEYDLKIGDVNFLSIDAKPKVEGIEVETTGNLDLENGSIIKIKVIYDENTYNIYKINIIKDIVEEDDNQTSKLIIIIVIVSIIIAIIVLLIIQLKNKKNGNNKKNSKNNKKEMPKEIKVEDKQEVVKKQNLISLADDEEIEDII